MKYPLYFLLVFVSVVFVGCEKEEPFEYPDDPEEPEETLIVRTERNIKGYEYQTWMIGTDIKSCSGAGNSPAFVEYDSNQNELVMHLVPIDSACDLRASAQTRFLSDEIAQESWDDLTFEFFFNEYLANPTTKFYVSLHYKNLEMKLDIAPYIDNIGLGGGNDGSLAIKASNGEFAFELSGVPITPQFDGENEYLNVLSSSTQEPFFEADLQAKETDAQSLVIFKYFRIFTIGYE